MVADIALLFKIGLLCPPLAMAVDPFHRSRVDWGYIFDPKQADPLERLKTFLESGGDLHALAEVC